MGVGRSSECCQDEAGSESASPTLESIAEGLADGRFENVVVMCGAGISTNAGVPDFRSPSAGLYFKLKKIPNLPYPEAVFDGSFFDRDPAPFYTLVREIYPERLVPTLTHRFFKLLSNKGILTRVFTQNIDALEFLAGLKPTEVVEAHGTFNRSYCKNCKKTYDLPWLKNAIFKTPGGVPKCSNCSGVVRPDVVLFGEHLPSVFFSRASTDFPKCDLLIVLGTSLAVAPFNSLVGRTKRGVPRLYINKSKPGAAGGFVPWLMGLGSNVDFSRKTDLIIQGDCDETIRKICNINGWTEELQSIPYKVLNP